MKNFTEFLSVSFSVLWPVEGISNQNNHIFKCESNPKENLFLSVRKIKCHTGLKHRFAALYDCDTYAECNLMTWS